MKSYILWTILLLIFTFRFYQTKPIYSDGDKIRINTRVASEPVRYETAQYLKLKGLKIYLPLYPEISYGDSVVVEGVVEDDKLMSPLLVDHNITSNLLFMTRSKLLKVYQANLPEPHSSLVAGVAIGSKASIPTEFWQKLKSTGTAHVVVASGMNVTLVAGFLMATLLNFIDRKKAIAFALIGVWLYVFIAGADAPIVRAGVMGSIAFSAQALGRLTNTLRILLLTALLMLIYNPAWVGDLGFILSFAATTSIILFEAKVRKKVQFLPSPLKEDFSTSLSAQVLVAPILYFSFGQFNIFSPLINAAVLWTIPLITIFGIFAGIVGLFVPLFGSLILLAIYPLTSWFIFVVNAL